MSEDDAFHEITKDPSAVKVGFNDWKISENTLFSTDAEDCNYTALFSGRLAALSHYDLAHPRVHVDRIPEPECYLTTLVNGLCANSGSTDLNAVVVGGEFKHFKRIRAFLEERRIPIVNFYLDHPSGETSWLEYRSQNPPDQALVIDQSSYTKNIIVRPSIREVIVYSNLIKPSGFKIMKI